MGTETEEDRCRKLEKLLLPTEELLDVAPGVHRSACGKKSRLIWLGIGRVRAREEYIVFIFARTSFAFLEKIREFLYCVLPVVANIAVDVEHTRCAFTWSPFTVQAMASGVLGDLIVEVAAGSGVLKKLQECYRDACQRGFVFHEEQRVNHKEVWLYKDAIPLDLAKLPSMAVSMPGERQSVVSVRERDDSSPLRLLCITWNVGATLPEDGQTLEQLLEQESAADIICVGLQETCELSARRLITDGDEWFAWREWTEQGVQDFHGDELELLSYSHLVGMLILVFVRTSLRDQVSNVRTTAIGVGLMKRGGNKGAVSIRFDISSTSFCFVNAHLAAGQEHYIERCKHFRTIMSRIRFQGDGEEGDGEDGLTTTDSRAPLPGAAGAREASLVEAPLRGVPEASFTSSAKSSAILSATAPSDVDNAGNDGQAAQLGIADHDHIFWIGDTNSRLHWPGKVGGMPILDAVHKVQERRIGELLALDQLNLMRKEGLAFQGFEEHPILFLPSYKWRPQGDALDMRSQKHVPAWCDRILFRSMTRPGATAHQYNVHLGLRQSDHRAVYANFSVPWTGQRPAAQPSCDDIGDLPAEGGGEASVSMEPTELAFEGLKPDQPRECSVRLVLAGAAVARFKVLLRSADGRLEPVGQGARARRMVARNTRRGTILAQDDVLDAKARGEMAFLARSLAVTPTQGSLREGRPIKLRICACVGEAVLRRLEISCSLVVRVLEHQDAELPIRASLVPSVFRAPLLALSELEARPLAAATGDDAPGPSSPRKATPLPPKEVLSVMQWVLQQSRDAPPGSLEWWPDPLTDGVSRGGEELREVQRHIEHGWPLPLDGSRLPPRSAALFLLHWLCLLPEPVLPQFPVEEYQARGCSTKAALQEMQPLPRSVLVCIAALFAQLISRHGQHEDVVVRLAGCLTQNTASKDASEALLSALMSESMADTAFPPLRQLAALA